MHKHTLTALLALLLGSATAHAQTEVRGHLQFDGERSAAVGGIAWIEDEVLQLVLADVEPDMDAIAADGQLDRMDLLQLGGRQLELRIDPESGELWGLTLSQPGEVLSGGHEGMDTALVLSTSGPWAVGDQVKGRFDDGSHAIEFDLAVLGTELPKPGTPLPADGGAPGAVFRAMVEAIGRGDLEILLTSQAAANRAEMQEAVDEGFGASLIARAQSFTVKPEGLQLHGGRATAQRAWVDYSGRDGFGGTRGTASLVMEDGAWKFEQTDSVATD
ncbi:MAG: hypothetical protein MEQ07_08595 [Aquimonas sp.]|nr:hypothetical protein [Aquimonas sp.]